VDDEPLLRQMGKTVLQRAGFQVLVASDGVQALDVYRRHSRSIHLIVLDRTMPNLSGRETLFQLLLLDPCVPVMFASGYSVENLTDEERRHMLGFVGKPFRADDLTCAVRNALAKAARSPT
jgi:DNA-binding NtrC family response regulator